MDLQDILSRSTEHGWLVKDVELLGGHHLVYKLPTATMGTFVMPDAVKKKSVSNIVMIRGLVVKSSSPFPRKRSKKYFAWDRKAELLSPKWKLIEGVESFPSEVKPGDGILYMSYNVGRVKVQGIREPLVVVREIDIISTFPMSCVDRIGLPSKAYKCASVKA